MNFDPTQFGAVPATNFDATKFGAVEANPIAQTPEDSGGFGSGFVQSVKEYDDQTPAQFVANDNVRSHALIPANQNAVNYFSDVPRGGGLKSIPAIVAGTAKGIGSSVVNAAKIIPNYASDFVMNVVPGIAGFFGNLGMTGYDYASGVVSGDLSKFTTDIHDGILGQVWRDPAVLAGSATRAVGFGLGQGIDKFWKGDMTGGLTDIAQGLQNGVTAFEDAPMSNLIAFKALGGISDAVVSPLETLESIKNKASSAGQAVVHPFDWMKENMPASLKVYTKSGLTDMAKAAEDKALQSMEVAKNLSEMEGKITSEDAASVEKTGIQTKISNAQDSLRSLHEQQNAMSQLALASTEDGLRIAAPTNPDAILSSIQKVADDANNVSSQGYRNFLPKTTPDFQPVLSAFEEFLNKVNQQDDIGTYKEFSKYYEKLKTNVSLNDEWAKALGDKTTFLKNVTEPGSKIGYEDAFKFADNPRAPEYRLPTTDLLKSDSKGTLNAMKENSGVTNTKLLYQNTIGAALSNTIDSEVTKAFGKEGLDSYHKADAQWGDAKELAKRIINPSETASDISAENKIRNNIDAIDKISPKTGDQVRSYFAAKILEDAKGDTGYSAQAILKGVNKYRDVLRQSDKDFLTEQTTEMAKNQQAITDIAMKQGIIGSNQIQMAEKIGNIKTINDLNTFVKLSGKTPEELGNLYRQSIYETALNKIGNVKGEENQISVIKEFLKNNEELGGKTPESEQVYRQMTDPNLQAAIENAKEQVSQYDKIKDVKIKGLTKRFIGASIGATFFAFGHTFFGSSLIVKNLMPDKVGDLSEANPLKVDAKGDLVREPKPTTPKKNIVQKVRSGTSKVENANVTKAGGMQANANENQPKGDAVTSEEATALGLPDWMVDNYTEAHLKADLEAEIPPDWFKEVAATRWPGLDENEAWSKIKQP